MNATQEPQGIAFFNIKSGETHYAKLEPTIAAYINSSDMGINASRDQDFSWRLGPDWVKRVKAFRNNPSQMQILSSQNQGQSPTDVQILYYLYGEELRNYHQANEENGTPFAEEYRKATISEPAPEVAQEESSDDMAGDIDAVMTEEKAKPAKTHKKAQ